MHGSPRAMKMTREPNGRPQRSPKEFPPAQVRRLRDAAMTGLRDPEWGTELGRLFLTEAITSAMYAAGKRWREDADQYRGAIDVRPLKSPSVERGIMGTEPDTDSPEGQKVAKRHRDSMEKFYAAHAALIGAGMMAESLVRRVCEDDKSAGSYIERNALRFGLSTLADHYQLTIQRKSQNVR